MLAQLSFRAEQRSLTPGQGHLVRNEEEKTDSPSSQRTSTGEDGHQMGREHHNLPDSQSCEERPAAARPARRGAGIAAGEHHPGGS